MNSNVTWSGFDKIKTNPDCKYFLEILTILIIYSI